MSSPSPSPRRRLLDWVRDFKVLPGRPLPLGVSATRRGFNFSVFSRHGTTVWLVLFAPQQHESLLELPLEPDTHRTGDIWHIELLGLDPALRYGWRVDRENDRQSLFHRYDVGTVLVDPYARALTGGARWGGDPPRAGEPPRTDFSRRRSIFLEREFDWEYLRPPLIPLPDKVIYEAHVRGFTQHPSSSVAHPGTYLGLIEKIPYLLELGITTVELLPVYEFDENETRRVNPRTGEPLKNFWGYSPICFFAPKAAYASDGREGRQVEEFKTLVRELHRHGLEVFLDVVFNHSAEGEVEDGPTFSFRGLDNKVYYMVDPATGLYRNFSGCGNTLNCNHPVVREMIIDALRYWVAEMRVDGFRFDLASILGRGPNGEVLPMPPVLEQIAADPVLADTTLIAEAWDAAGLNQVGRFPHWGRWAEWNSLFRDDVRRFVRGDAFAGALATRLAGSSDLYEASHRQPCHSVNYVTCHDGFTLADLVSYERKHNEENGEEGRDGTDESWSANGGVEGPTDDPEIVAFRSRQVRFFLTLLMLSQGTPMLLAGDELGRTQRGNNNAYCQDNEVSWIDWSLLDGSAGLFRFTKLLVAFRKAHPALRRRGFLTGRGSPWSPRPDVAWHGVRLNAPDWTSRALAMHLAGEHAPEPDRDIYLAANASPEDLVFELPPLPGGLRWRGAVNTAMPSPEDIAEPGHEVVLARQDRALVRARSCLVLLST